MVERKKLCSRLLSAFMSVVVACSSLCMSAFAEDSPPDGSFTVNDVYSQYSFCVTLDSPNVFFTRDESQASYPRIAKANDISLVYKTGGKEYRGVLADINDSSRLYGFSVEGMVQGSDDSILPQPAGTLVIENDYDGFDYSFDGGKTEIEVGSLSWVHPITVITKDDPRWARVYPTLTGDAKEVADRTGTVSLILENKYLTTVTAGLNTASAAGFSVYDGSYGVKPNFISGATLCDGDKEVAEGTVSQGYIVSFDMTGLDMNKSYKVEVLFFDSNANNAPRLGTMQWRPTVNSSSQTEYHLMSEFSWELGDALGEMEEPDVDNPNDGEDEIIWGEEEGIYDSEFRIALHSELSKYDTTVSGIDTTATLSGKATEFFVENNDRAGAAVGDTVVWERFSVARTAGIRASVEAGEYSLAGSDQLNLNYSGSFKIGSNEKKDVELTVSPKYTLNITSKAGEINCTVDGYSFTGIESQDLALVGDVAYTVVDNDSGKVYSIKPTNEQPHLKVVLGEDGYMIADGVDGNNFIDEVPKTADPIVVISLIFIGLLAAFGVSFFFVYRANKKKGDV